MSIISGIRAISLSHLHTEFNHQATSSRKGHHLGLMCGSGADEGSGKGRGDNNFFTMRFVASYNHGCHRNPTATTGLYSWQKAYNNQL